MKLRRKFTFVLYTVLCMLLMTNCKKTDTVQTPPVPEQTGITLTFGHHRSAFPQSIVYKLAQDFEDQTGIHIEFEEYPDAQWRDLLKAKLLDGSAPDIFAADSDPFSLYERIRPDINCIDLSSQEFVSRLDPDVLPAISYHDKVYGIPFSGKKIWVYSYNKEIFQKLNLDIPTNYEELKNVCQRIKDSGIIPIWQMPSTGWHQVLPLFETGPYYQSKTSDLYGKLNRNEVNIEDVSGLLTVIKEINEFSDLGFYGDNYFGNSYDDVMDQFGLGKVAMHLELIGWPNQVISEYPNMQGKVGIFLMPWADNQIIGVNPAQNAYYGNVNSAHKKEILQFFQFLAEHDNLQKRLDGDPTTLELCWPEIANRYPKEYTAYLSQFKSGIVMQAGVSYIDTQWMEVGADIEKMYADLMTPEEVLKEIAKRRNKLAKMTDDPYWK